MSRDKIAAYADAVASIVEAEGQAERTADELFRVARAFESNDQLRTTLSDGTIPAERRQQVVEQLLGGRAQATTVQVVSFLVATGRVRDLPAIVDAVVQRVASGRDQHVAEVRSAIALTSEQEQRLAAALAKATGKTVDLKVVVDPSVLGGLVATVGDEVIDGTVRSRLDQLKTLI
ncbi:MAG: ATP synthase F1 subunit delta [Actinobacteria bacterium]|jgi:F-type H+-transporting ATPase subunit delta|nr:ATP synthase F1 subunit delta [Actinomycetota bacterium]